MRRKSSKSHAYLLLDTYMSIIDSSVTLKQDKGSCSVGLNCQAALEMESRLLLLTPLTKKNKLDAFIIVLEKK